MVVLNYGLEISFDNVQQKLAYLTHCRIMASQGISINGIDLTSIYQELLIQLSPIPKTDGHGDGEFDG